MIRIVHGGSSFTAPVRIDDRVMEKLSKLEPLAPLHQPHNLSGIRTRARLGAARASGRMLRYRVSSHDGSPRASPRLAAGA